MKTVICVVDKGHNLVDYFVCDCEYPINNTTRIFLNKIAKEKGGYSWIARPNTRYERISCSVIVRVNCVLRKLKFT